MTDIPVKQKLLSFEEILEERISSADLTMDPPEMRKRDNIIPLKRQGCWQTSCRRNWAGP